MSFPLYVSTVLHSMHTDHMFGLFDLFSRRFDDPSFHGFICDKENNLERLLDSISGTPCDHRTE